MEPTVMANEIHIAVNDGIHLSEIRPDSSADVPSMAFSYGHRAEIGYYFTD